MQPLAYLLRNFDGSSILPLWEKVKGKPEKRREKRTLNELLRGVDCTCGMRQKGLHA